MENLFKPKRRKNDGNGSSTAEQSTLMSLSLFIILLAFFIVMNGLSEFSKPKVDQAFGSLNMTFSTSIIDSSFDKTSSDDHEEEDDGQGDAMEMLQGTLRSILPNLSIVSEPSPNGGKMMAVRITKNQFENVSDALFPLFVRLLNHQDMKSEYGLEITSYVRESTSESAQRSFAVLNEYMADLEKAGLARDRLSAVIENGNPAWLMLHFKKDDSVDEVSP